MAEQFKQNDRDGHEGTAVSEQNKNASRGKAEAHGLSRRSKGLIFIASVTAVAIGMIFGIPWYLEARKWQSTENAYIKASVTRLSPGIPGHVSEVFVQNNQRVEAGQPLVLLSDRAVRASLEEAEAALAASVAEKTTAEAALASARASLTESEATARARGAEAEQAQQSYTRYERLENQAVSEIQRDEALGQAISARETARAAEQTVRSQATRVPQAEAELAAAVERVRQAEARLTSARLRQEDATLRAPISGQITQFEVEPGDYLAPGTPVTAIVGPARWVEANFKEDQLRLMRHGQFVEVRIDTWSDFPLRGRVESFQAGSGAEFSALPAQNATSNWVKTVQRVPVRIHFEENAFAQFPSLAPVVPGLSVEARVKVIP